MIQPEHLPGVCIMKLIFFITYFGPAWYGMRPKNSRLRPFNLQGCTC